MRKTTATATSANSPASRRERTRVLVPNRNSAQAVTVRMISGSRAVDRTFISALFSGRRQRRIRVTAAGAVEVSSFGVMIGASGRTAAGRSVISTETAVDCSTSPGNRPSTTTSTARGERIASSRPLRSPTGIDPAGWPAP